MGLLNPKKISMKKILALTAAFGFIAICNAQTTSSTNAGAVSNNNIIYSVGEIFVIPTNPDETSSGIIGALSIIEFATLSTADSPELQNMKVYPNPTADRIIFDVKNTVIKKVFVYDVLGKLVLTQKAENNQVSLTRLKKGIYFLRPNNSRNYSIKIIKK